MKKVIKICLFLWVPLLGACRYQLNIKYIYIDIDIDNIKSIKWKAALRVDLQGNQQLLLSSGIQPVLMHRQGKRAHDQRSITNFIVQGLMGHASVFYPPWAPRRWECRTNCASIWNRSEVVCGWSLWQMYKTTLCLHSLFLGTPEGRTSIVYLMIVTFRRWLIHIFL